MRQLQFFVIALLGSLAAFALFVPPEIRSTSLSIADSFKRSIASISSLEKRKGGGGKGGGSSGGSSSGGKGGSSGSSGSSSGSRSSSSSSSSSSGSKSGSGSTSGSSNSGGRSVSGTGPRPAYGGGAYGGGASVPYQAGTRTPKGLLALGLLPVAGIGFLGAAWVGSWAYGAYPYHYSRPWSYYNSSSNRNETTPVECLCGQYNVCGCDDNDDPVYIKSIVGDGSYNNLNKSVVQVSDGNGTKTIYLNGDLPNGTTASGGTDSAGSRKQILYSWVAIGLFVATAISTM